MWPHTGPTNCRLRLHLGLKVPPGTGIRVAGEKRCAPPPAVWAVVGGFQRTGRTGMGQ